MNVLITPVWVDERLIYHTRIPLVLPTRWDFVELRRWPVPTKEFQTTLVLPETLLRDTESGDITLIPHCSGISPRVCRRGLITRATAHPCLTRLLADTPTYDPECAVIVERRFPFDTIDRIGHEEYVLVTNGTQLALRCAGRAERTATVDAGVYKIRLNFPCHLHGTKWTLRSTFQHEVNVTLKTNESPFQLNVTIAELFKKQYEFDAFKLNLTTMNAVDRRQIKVFDLVNPLTDAFQTPSKKVWHSLWLLVLVVLLVAAVVVYGRRLYRRRHPPTKAATPKLELSLETRENKSSAAPRADNVFQFVAPAGDEQETQC